MTQMTQRRRGAEGAEGSGGTMRQMALPDGARWRFALPDQAPRPSCPLGPVETAVVYSQVSTDGQVAQLVEHVTENHGVGGSIPSLATTQSQYNQDFSTPGERRATHCVDGVPLGSRWARPSKPFRAG